MEEKLIRMSSNRQWDRKGEGTYSCMVSCVLLGSMRMLRRSAHVCACTGMPAYVRRDINGWARTCMHWDFERVGMCSTKAAKTTHVLFGVLVVCARPAKATAREKLEIAGASPTLNSATAFAV